MCAVCYDVQQESALVVGCHGDGEPVMWFFKSRLDSDTTEEWSISMERLLVGDSFPGRKTS